VDAARSDPPMPRARACARAAQRREQERLARRRERWLWRRERRERRDEEFRLREQQGLSPQVTSEDSLEEEEEKEDDRGRAFLERWEPTPPLPEAAEAARERAQGHPPQGGPQLKRSGPQRHWCASQRHPRTRQRCLEARRRRRRPHPQRLLSPRGRGSTASPP
jgi:hypothetical protein